MTEKTPPQIFDKTRQMLNLMRAKNNAASDVASGASSGASSGAGNNADFLLDYAIEDFQDRLQFVQRDFQLAIDLFGRNGKLSKMLQDHPSIKNVKRFEEGVYIYKAPYIAPANIVENSILGLEAEQADLIVSSFALHWSNDLLGDLIQIRRGLKPDGLFLGLIPGQDTLQELRESLLIADSEIFGGALSRIDPFADVRDMGMLMQRAKFALPVVDVDRLVVRYDHPMNLIKDLRQMGANSALIRESKFANKAFLKRMCEVYQEKFSDADGRIRASFSFISLSGWAPSENQPKALKPGSATVRLADALNTSEKKI